MASVTDLVARGAHAAGATVGGPQASGARGRERGATAARAGATQLLASEALVLSGVTRAFGALRAVDDVSLSVGAGQKYAILGSNGAGKTTLFNAITGDFPPTAGRILFFGEDITELEPHDRIRKGLRRTYQSSLLFRDLTVRDNLFLAVRGVASGRYAFWRPRATHPSVRATSDLLERVRLSHVADDPVSTLAHGQQRQLEIGMALAGAPRLILFDEPAAGLSPAERRELVILLRSLPSHMSFVLIEHDLDIALRVVEKVTVMHNGRVLVTGTPEQIEKDAQVQSIYMGARH
jgi:branched-chain amino acid transport system ATP-binding protein